MSDSSNGDPMTVEIGRGDVVRVYEEPDTLAAKSFEIRGITSTGLVRVWVRADRELETFGRAEFMRMLDDAYGFEIRSE